MMGDFSIFLNYIFTFTLHNQKSRTNFRGIEKLEVLCLTNSTIFVLWANCNEEKCSLNETIAIKLKLNWSASGNFTFCVIRR